MKPWKTFALLAFFALVSTGEVTGTESTKRTFAPIVLPEHLPFRGTTAPVHERELFGWSPSFAVNTPAFDNLNRAFFRMRSEDVSSTPPDGFQHFDGNQLVTTPYLQSVLKAFPAGTTLVSIYKANGDFPALGVFDAKDRLYTVLRAQVRLPNLKLDVAWILLSSHDYGANWTATRLAGLGEFSADGSRCPVPTLGLAACPFPGSYDLERPYGAENIPGSPSVLLYQQLGQLERYQGGVSWMGSFGRLVLYLTSSGPDGAPVVNEKVTLTERAMGIGYHSGGAPRLLRNGNKIFITWAEVSELGDSSPVFVAEYDLASRTLSKREVLPSYPVNDAHNQPGLVQTRNGTLHVLSGGHGSHFYHASSLMPASISAWSATRPINTFMTGDAQKPCPNNMETPSGGCQTYLAMMIDPTDRIHVVYRQWRRESAILGFRYFGALVHQSFNTGNWSAPKVLVYPNAWEYSIYYHHLAMNKKGHLFLDYAQSRPYLPYVATDGTVLIPPFRNAALLKSEDAGDSWFLVRDRDLTDDQKWVPLQTFAGTAKFDSGIRNTLLFITRDSRTSLLTYGAGSSGLLQSLAIARLPDGAKIHQYPALAGDWNGDGITDVAFLFRETPGILTLRLKLGADQGQFLSKQLTLQVPDAATEGRAFLADIDGDKKAELLLVFRENGILKAMTAKEAPDSSFSQVTSEFPDGTAVNATTSFMGDFDADGKADLGLLNLLPGKLQVRYRYSRGFGSWAPAYREVPWTPLTVTEPVHVLDADGNGRDDIAFSYRNDSNQFVTRTILNGTTTATVVEKTFPDGSIVSSMPNACGRLDGKPGGEQLLQPFWEPATGLLYHRAKTLF